MIKTLSFFIVSIVLLLACESASTPSQSTDPRTYSGAANGEFDDMVSTYEDENRHIWQKPDRVIELLGDVSDKTIVDIGAGSGYFAFRLLRVAKKVVAVDIDPRFIRFMNEKKTLLSPEEREKFEARLASADDPMLAEGEAEAVLIVNTYAYISDRVAYLKNLKAALAPGAKIVIIEFKMKDIPEGPPPEEKIPLATTEQELKEAGYRITKIDDKTLDYQYIITATAD